MSSLTIISGLPGNGKTLYAINLMRELKAAGRFVLVMNFDGLDPSVAKAWSGPIENWKDLPAGTVLFIDEAQDFLATNGKGGSPEWVKDFSKVRHGGLEIVFITQDPRFLDPWVRRLANRHIHLVRTKGLQVAAVHEWDRVKDDPVEYHAIEASTKSVFRYPKELYTLYKSANIHTVKAKIPKRLWLYAALIPLFCWAVWYTMHLLGHMGGSPEAKALVANGIGGAKVELTGSAEAWAKKFTPVVPSQPWSAPAYADKKPEDFPVLSCIASEQKCLCITQQGTRYHIDNYTCKLIATEGVFNPFDSTRRDRKAREGDQNRLETGRERAAAVDSPRLESPSGTVAAASSGSSSSGQESALQRPPGVGRMGHGPIGASSPIAGSGSL